ncbi:MAG: GGDEF domain-containing protein [Desulfobacteraceae bacterium]|nr:GGDEF domain-containing protein [Desulfobacteraceae bacterium]
MISVTPKNDRKQALRIRRFFIGAASYVMWFILILYCHHLGFLRLSFKWALLGCGIAAGINVILYLIFRTGLNKKFNDPSLTFLQMALAALAAMVGIYYTDNIRGIMLVAYIVTILFGVFRFSIIQYLIFTIFSITCYGTVILLLLNNHPETITLQIEVLQLVVFATVMTWFSMVGSYMRTIRKKLSSTNYRLNNALSTIRELAIHDDLTQAYNRRQMFEELKREKTKADRIGDIFSIALFDIDHFKKVNDTYGHLKGDDVLKYLIHSIRHEIREIDSISRYGGEEFIIIMSGTDTKGAEEGAYRIKNNIENLKFPGFSDSFRMTISTGIATYQPVESIDDLIARSDSAMYKAKSMGRNQVVAENTK